MKAVEKDTVKNLLPSQFADMVGLQYTATVSKKHKKEEGQFFTPKQFPHLWEILLLSPHPEPFPF